MLLALSQIGSSAPKTTLDEKPGRAQANSIDGPTRLSARTRCQADTGVPA